MLEEEKAIKNLRKYVDEDVIYKNKKAESDFDEYCISHCKDIETILNLIQSRLEEIKELNLDKDILVNVANKYIEELEKKEEIINEMAPQVYLNKQQREEMKKYINKLDNKPKDFTSFVKQYFEKKVEGK